MDLYTKENSLFNPMSMLKVSVIIPTYNCACYIKDAIESVLNQGYKELEVIIIDDGSVDNTKDILKPYVDQGIIKYIFQEPRGVSAARNLGIQHANGELIAFQDADDIWYPNKLLLQLIAFEKYRGAALMFTSYEHLDGNGVILEPFWNKFLGRWWESYKIPGSNIAYGPIYKELLVGGNCMHTSSVIVKKEAIVEAGGFDERFKTCEDYDLWMRITKKYPVLFVNKVLCGYRVRSEGLSGDKMVRESRWAHDHIRVVEKHFQERLIPSNYHKIMKKLQAKQCWDVGWSYFNQDSFDKARSFFLKGLSYNAFYLKLWIYFVSTFLPLSAFHTIRKLSRFVRHL